MDYSGFESKPEPHSYFEGIYRILSFNKFVDRASLKKFAIDNIGKITFKEAFTKTGIIMNIAIAGDKYEPYRLLNYMTAPEVLVYTAAIASTSFPTFFGKCDILKRDSEGRESVWFSLRQNLHDGTLGDDLPKAYIAQHFGVNNFIVSQANPYIARFVPSGRWAIGSIAQPFLRLIKKGRSLLTLEARKRAKQIPGLINSSRLPSKLAKLVKMMNQDYAPQLTLSIKSNLYDRIFQVSKPSKEETGRFARKGDIAAFYGIFF